MVKNIRTNAFGPTVYIPFANSKGARTSMAEVIGAVINSTLPYELVNVGRSESAYFDLLNKLWAEGRTFLIVEHDIVVTSDELRAMAKCPHEWCANAYPYLGGVYAGLGCVKFSRTLIKKIPSVMSAVGALGARDLVHPSKHWCALDGRLRATLEIAGNNQHKHYAKIKHLNHNGKPSHNCYSDTTGELNE
jgi:hypothetical protein